MTNKEAYEKYKKEAENFGGLTSKITNYVEELEHDLNDAENLRQQNAELVVNLSEQIKELENTIEDLREQLDIHPHGL